jgi:EmrB/QacA subfamily drug resistance transporter
MTDTATAAPAPKYPPGVTPGKRIGVLAALLLATVLASLDSSFVPIAFPDMIDKLDTSTSVVVWVALGYLISATGLMLLSSRLSQLLGSDRVYQIGVVVYALAMIACAWAPDIETLIVLRVVQGVGMALFLPITFTIASELYLPQERLKALSIMQAGNALGFVLGPVFAGWLLDAYDWRALFSTRIPLALLAVAGTFLVVDRRYRERTSPVQNWDLAGATLLTLSIFGLLFGLNRLPVEDNHRDWLVWFVAALGVAALVFFVRQERRAAAPLIDLSLFKESPEFTRAAIAFTAYFAALPVQLFILPLVLIAAMEFTAWDTGMTLAVIALVTTIVNGFAGALAKRYRAGQLAVYGVIATMLGYLALLPVQPDHGQLELMPAMVLLGIGSALFFAPNNSLLLGSVPERARVTAASLIGVLRQSGYAVGFALIASLVTALQDNIEEIWTAASAAHLQERTATGMAYLFEEGGIFSPEVLFFIMRVGVLLAMVILTLCLVTSWPNLALSRRGKLLVGTATIAAATVAILGIAAASGIPVSFSGAAASPPDPKSLTVSAFGMVSRTVESQQPAATTEGGAQLFATHCAACHGGDGRGVAELGVTLVDSSYTIGLTSEQLVEFLKVGRMPGQPGSIRNGVMPGFAYLPADELAEIAAYVKGIHR